MKLPRGMWNIHELGTDDICINVYVCMECLPLSYWDAHPSIEYP